MKREIPHIINGKTNPEYRRQTYWLSKGYTIKQYLNIKDELDKKKQETTIRANKRKQIFIPRKSKMTKYEYQKDLWLKCKYNISLEDYKKLFDNQSKKCKICSKIFKNYSEAHLDHCHKTGKIRGLLCNHCNFGLGHFKDNKELLVKAIDYLQ